MIRLLTIIVICLPVMLQAQSQLSMYRLNDMLPQANMLNPAFRPKHRVVIGLPAISSFYISSSTDGLAFRDVFIRTDQEDSLKIDTLGLPGKLHKQQKLDASNALQLFYVGISGKRSYFSLGIHQISDTRLSYPGEAVGWAILGPNDPRYQGRALSFDNLYGKSTVYNQVSLNYARAINEKLTAGIRVKYLVGLVAGTSGKIKGSVRTTTDSVTLSSGAMKIQTAGIDFFDQDDLSTEDYIRYTVSNNNRGMAIDIGATYQISQRVSVSAAINDLGYINWKDYTRSYNLDPVTYTFKGFDMLDYLNENDDASLEKETDSLEALYTFDERTGEKFRTSLVGKLYAGVNYRVAKGNQASALLYLDVFRGTLNPAVSIAYDIQLGRMLNAVISAAYRDGKVNNFGAGLVVKLGGIQLFATSDRFNSFIYPARASMVDAHVGMNLVFGNPQKKEDVKPSGTVPDRATEIEPVPDEPVNSPDSLQQDPAKDSLTMRQVTMIRHVRYLPVVPQRHDMGIPGGPIVKPLLIGAILSDTPANLWVRQGKSAAVTIVQSPRFQGYNVSCIYRTPSYRVCYQASRKQVHNTSVFHLYSTDVRNTPFCISKGHHLL